MSQAAVNLFNVRWRPDSVKAESKYQHLAGNWFFIFLSWQTRQLGCICRSNSCQQWERQETKLLPEFNVYMESFDCLLFTQPRNSNRHHKMPSWHVTTDHQRHFPAEPSKVRKAIILCFFEIDKACKKIFAIFSDFSNIEKKFNTTMKSWSPNRRLIMIENWRKNLFT